MSCSHLVKDTKNFKTGFLTKKGGSIKTWHRRFFILKGDILLYFKDDTNLYHPLAVIYLYKGIINKNPLYAKKNNTFLVNTQGRRYHFQASSDEEREEWCDVLESCIKSMANKDTDQVLELQKLLEKEKMKIITLSKNIEISLKPFRDLKLDIKKLQYAVSSTNRITRERTRGVTLRHDYLDDSTLLNTAQEKIKTAKDEAIYTAEVIAETQDKFEEEMNEIKKTSLSKTDFDPILKKIEALKAGKNEIQSLLIQMQEDFVRAVYLILKQFDKLDRDTSEKAKIQRTQSVLLRKKIEEQLYDEEKEKIRQQVTLLKEKVLKNKEEIKTLNEHKDVLVKELKRRQATLQK